MTAEGAIVAAVLLALVVVWIGAPLRSVRNRASVDTVLHQALQTQKRRDRLLVYYERVITNVRDLDEDLATGKIADSDYQDERETWVRRGIQALKAFDALESAEYLPVTVQHEQDEAAIDRDIDDAIEAAIAAYRNQ